jgi:probable rRNA maturation factor
VAATQATENGRTLEQELDLLLTHGILHLLGFDHAEPDEKREMFGLQDSILASWSRPAAGAGER